MRSPAPAAIGVDHGGRSDAIISLAVAPQGQRRAQRRLGPGLAVSLGVIMLLLAGCSPATETNDDPPTATPSISNAEGGTPSASPSLVTSEIIGYWHRAQTCAELFSAFEAAGLAQSHAGWLQGNFYGGAEGPTTGDLCAGAEGPLEHSHWFIETGEFGSHDQAGQQVDSGDYILVDPDTLSFPSHSSEFGFGGEILVDFAVNEGTTTFQVTVPEPCDAACQNAHAWALSAFASGPWAVGDVP
jgi:hypothetical protein